MIPCNDIHTYNINLNYAQPSQNNKAYTFGGMDNGSISGTSLNPAKNFGPALVLNLWQNQWIYFTAPIIGALLATAAYRYKIFGTMELMTAKLFHTPSYRCIFLYCKERH